jgi:AraC-like DNA-binding protein
MFMDQCHIERKKMDPAFPFFCWENTVTSFPLHWHDCFEVLLVSRGGIPISINDTTFETSAGDIALINSGVIHGYLDSDPGTTIKGFQFDITFFDESFITLRDAIFQNPILGKKTGTEAVCGQLRQLLYEILHEYTEKTIGYQLAIKSKIYELMFMILREMSWQYVKASSAKSKQMLAFILKNVGDPDSTLEEAADALNLNKFYFSHVFKNITGQSFHSYLVKTRVAFAKHYLKESNMSITDIAFHSGFNSLQTFNRVFKSLTGFTPGNYRRENGASAAVFKPRLRHCVP